METISFAQIGLFFACVVVLVGVGVGAKILFTKSPPLHKEYVSREEHAAFVEKMDAELGRERGARKQIHQEITALQAGVEVVKQQNAQQSSALADVKTEQSKIRDRIDDVPQRTINLLRSSGALK